MPKSSHHWLLFKITIACVAACVVWLPGAFAQDQPRVPLTSGGMAGGLHYGAPLKWSVALGYLGPFEPGHWQPFVAAEPGLGGWRAGVGGLKTTNDLGGGYIARASVLRTGSKAWRAPSDATYIGPEFQFMPIFAIGARVGAFTRVGGKGARGLTTADLSLMF